MASLKTFTVLKELVSVYAVEVEAENATDAILKAYSDNHDSGDLVNDFTQNESEWEVYEGLTHYPLDDASLPRDKAAIESHITGGKD